MEELSINFPKENEVINSEHYAINVSAKGLSDIRVDINGGGWQFPKFWDGNYYIDWYPSKKGKNVITVQAKDSLGKIIKLKRICYFLEKPKRVKK